MILKLEHTDGQQAIISTDHIVAMKEHEYAKGNYKTAMGTEIWLDTGGVIIVKDSYQELSTRWLKQFSEILHSSNGYEK